MFMTVSALSDRGLAEPANGRAGVRAAPRRAASWPAATSTRATLLVTGWHVHDVHQIEYAIGGVVEVETAAGHYLLPPQQAAWIPAGLRTPGDDEPVGEDAWR